MQPEWREIPGSAVLISHVPGSPALESQGVFIQNEDFSYLLHPPLRMTPNIR